LTSSPPSLLVGAAGQVGAQMLRLLGPDRALPTSRTPPAQGWLNIDLAVLSNPSAAAALLAPHPVDAIYCIAGMTDVEACEGQPELAHQVNALAPAALAAYARHLRLPFVYFSTEYIFDGHSGPYSEDDPPNPISVYGRSKLAGEIAVLDAHPDALILRTTVVYGMDERRKNYIYSLLSAIAAGRSMRVPEDQVSTPTFNQDLVSAAVGLVSANARGIWHVCGPERLSRIDFARSVLRFLDVDPQLLDPLPTARLGQRAPRPLSAGLRTQKLTAQHPGLRMRNLHEALDLCAPELHQHFHTQQRSQAHQHSQQQQQPQPASEGKLP